jgi:hypothetical protein
MITKVPSLGFIGERWPANYVLEIPVEGKRLPIRIYGWMGEKDGYNLFLPENLNGEKCSASFQAHQLLDMVCCIHDYLNTHGGNNEA